MRAPVTGYQVTDIPLWQGQPQMTARLGQQEASAAWYLVTKNGRPVPMVTPGVGFRLG